MASTTRLAQTASAALTRQRLQNWVLDGPEPAATRPDGPGAAIVAHADHVSVYYVQRATPQSRRPADPNPLLERQMLDEYRMILGAEDLVVSEVQEGARPSFIVTARSDRAAGR